MSVGNFAAVISAAGLSSRMGDFKPLMSIGGQIHILREIRTFLDCGVRTVLVVAGYRAKDVEQTIRENLEEVKRERVRLALNPEFAHSQMMDSIKIGLRSLWQESKEWDGIFIVPVDVPLFTEYTIRKLEEGFRSDPGGDVFVPQFQEEPGHPLLISRRAVGEILRYTGEGGLCGYCDSIGGRRVFCRVPDRGAVLEADTPQEFRRLEEEDEERKIPSEETCLRLLRWAGTSRERIDHCLAVGQTAYEMAEEFRERLGEKGSRICPERVRAAGRLHDIMKDLPDHANAGADFLEQLGYREIASLVRTHMDLPEGYLESCNENLIVYLADKQTMGTRQVSVEERFLPKRIHFQDDPEAMKALEERYQKARRAFRLLSETGKEKICGQGH